MAITPTGPATASALAGLQAGMDGVRRNAAEIASQAQMEGTAARPVYQPLVENLTYELQARASVKVIQTENRMLGSLLDVKA